MGPGLLVGDLPPADQLERLRLGFEQDEFAFLPVVVVFQYDGIRLTVRELVFRVVESPSLADFFGGAVVGDRRLESDIVAGPTAVQAGDDGEELDYDQGSPDGVGNDTQLAVCLHLVAVFVRQADGECVIAVSVGGGVVKMDDVFPVGRQPDFLLGRVCGSCGNGQFTLEFFVGVALGVYGDFARL